MNATKIERDFWLRTIGKEVRRRLFPATVFTIALSYLILNDLPTDTANIGIIVFFSFIIAFFIGTIEYPLLKFTTIKCLRNYFGEFEDKTVELFDKKLIEKSLEELGERKTEEDVKILKNRISEIRKEETENIIKEFFLQRSSLLHASKQNKNDFEKSLLAMQRNEFLSREDRLITHTIIACLFLILFFIALLRYPMSLIFSSPFSDFDIEPTITIISISSPVSILFFYLRIESIEDYRDYLFREIVPIPAYKHRQEERIINLHNHIEKLDKNNHLLAESKKRYARLLRSRLSTMEILQKERERLEDLINTRRNTEIADFIGKEKEKIDKIAKKIEISEDEISFAANQSVISKTIKEKQRLQAIVIGLTTILLTAIMLWKLINLEASLIIATSIIAAILITTLINKISWKISEKTRITRLNYAIYKYPNTVLKDKDIKVRRSAIQAFGKFATSIPSKVPVDPIIEALKDDDKTVRLGAIQALDEVIRTVPAKVPVDPLIKALKDDDREVRLEAAKALSKAGSSVPDKVPVYPLIEALKDERWEVRLGIVEALYKLLKTASDKAPPDQSIEPSKDDDGEKLIEASGALSKAEGSVLDIMTIDPLIETLKDDDREARLGAIQNLNKAIRTEPDKVPIDPIIEALKDDDREVRLGAVGALTKVGESIPGKIPVYPLIETLKDDDWGVRLGAAKALGIIGRSAPEKAIDPLIEALKRGDHLMRLGVAKALGMIGEVVPEKAIDTLIETLKDDNREVRLWITKALGIIGESAPEKV
ncbi:MAG: HEAT repeat domain-containing protein, partial [Candidatus Wukongarchaeota archaeon]|nr:HEAT repeat domain-containing protein [Candidatus Wukongarchaeota archaeon]